jgi:chromosomal replication initiation ATPase DnaA
VDALIAEYEAAVHRLVEIAAEIRQLDTGAGELARLDVLRNPDRLEDAEALLVQTRDRMRPLPEPPEWPRFDQLTLDHELLAVRAARAVAAHPGDRYNPFFVHAPTGAGKTSLLTALALLFREHHPESDVAFMTGEHFAAELIVALKNNRVDSWRGRYRRARLLVIDGVDALVDTERAQEELFHFFDSARRAGVQLVFSAACAPRDLGGLEERLRTRLESGLVVDLLPTATVDDELAAELAAAGEEEHAAPRQVHMDRWFMDREKILWHWPYLQDSLLQDPE